MCDLEKLIVEHYTAKFELEIGLQKQKCADIINCQAQIKNKSKKKLLRKALKKVHYQTERLQLAQRVIDNGLIKTTIMLAKQLSPLPGVQKAAKQSRKIFFLKFGFCKSLPMSKGRSKYLAALAFDQILIKIRYAKNMGYVIQNSVSQEKIILELMDVVRNSLKEPRHKRSNNIMCSPLSCPSSLSFSPQTSPDSPGQMLFSPPSCLSSISFSPLSLPTTPSTTTSSIMTPLFHQSTSPTISPSKLSWLAIRKKSIARRHQQMDTTKSEYQPRLSKPMLRSPINLVPGSPVKEIISSFRERRLRKSQQSKIHPDTESEYQPRSSKDITIERSLRQSIERTLSKPILRERNSQIFSNSPSGLVPGSPVKTIIRTLSKPILRERNSQIFSNSPSGLVPGSPVKQITSSFRERRFSKSQGYEKSIKENTNFHKKTIHSLSLRPLVLVYENDVKENSNFRSSTCFVPGSSIHRSAAPLPCLGDPRSSTCFVPGSPFHRSAAPLPCLEDQKQQKSLEKKHQQRQKKLRNQKLATLKVLRKIYQQHKAKNQKDNNDHKSRCF